MTYQGHYGFRARSDWGAGDTLSEYAEGDIVYIPAESPCVMSPGRCETGPGVHRVVSVFSISEGPEFYYRVCPMEATGRGDRWRTRWDAVSGRLHVMRDIDFTEGWVLLHRAVGGAAGAESAA